MAVIQTPRARSTLQAPPRARVCADSTRGFRIELQTAKLEGAATTVVRDGYGRSLLLEVADGALRTGDFQGFGDALDELRALLERLSTGPTN